MGITTTSADAFIPEIWQAALQEPYAKTTRFAQSSIVARQEIQAGKLLAKGDTLHITSIGDITVNEYDANADLDVEDLTFTGSEMKIDKGDYFNFRVEDVTAVQAAGPIKDPAMRAAAAKLAAKTDKYIAGLLKAEAKHKIGSISIAETSRSIGINQITAFEALIKLDAKLSSADAPREGRVAFVGPSFYAALLTDERFTTVNASGTSDGLRNGMVGRAMGFDIIVTNSIEKTANREIITAVVPGALVFVNQFNKIEAMRSEKCFADLIRGLNVYGGKVIRPEGVATLEADVKTVPPVASETL
ncbi:hypothetical protein D881_03175 [Corynebacterium ulcerans NCTC 12077]|uniref:phage capsid protein n=1 Tax=Corynebacterium ulcerans TaxID=65058 RepID=UPI0003C794FC|nr:phage capsid protein [Corynebacterium ulcerans]ESU58850.1 hypothetical protein D881_03175 [Corynebacterium ulcerans NCTC 12077]